MRKIFPLFFVISLSVSAKAQTTQYELVNSFCRNTAAPTIAGWAHPVSTLLYYDVNRSYGDSWDIKISYKYSDRYWTCTYQFRMDELGEPQGMSASCGDHAGWFSCFSGMTGLMSILSKLTEDEKNTAVRVTGKLLSEITAIDAAFASLYLKWKNWGYYQKY
jgi:hypothetical protein